METVKLESPTLGLTDYKHLKLKDHTFNFFDLLTDCGKAYVIFLSQKRYLFNIAQYGANRSKYELFANKRIREVELMFMKKIYDKDFLEQNFDKLNDIFKHPFNAPHYFYHQDTPDEMASKAQEDMKIVVAKQMLKVFYFNDMGRKICEGDENELANLYRFLLWKDGPDSGSFWFTFEELPEKFEQVIRAVQYYKSGRTVKQIKELLRDVFKLRQMKIPDDIIRLAGPHLAKNREEKDKLPNSEAFQRTVAYFPLVEFEDMERHLYNEWVGKTSKTVPLSTLLQSSSCVPRSLTCEANPYTVDTNSSRKTDFKFV